MFTGSLRAGMNEWMSEWMKVTMEILLIVLAHQHAKLLESLLSCTQPVAKKFHAEPLAAM